MREIKPDWRRNKLVKIFQTYHSAIRARSKEGRQYTMRAFSSVLAFEGMRVDKLGPSKGFPFCNETGEGYLLVENALLVDVIYTPQLTPRLVSEGFSEMPDGLVKNCERFLFNFGSIKPQGYPGPIDLAMSHTFLNASYLEDVPEFRPFVTPFPILTTGEENE
jgi:hypothetical protein